MKVAVDSSSFAKRYVQEFGSEKLDGLLQSASELAFCVILVPELVSGLNRRLRERVLTIGDYRAVRKQLLDDVRDATVLQITPSVISRSVKLLESNVLRALDALHVACALEWEADIFVTSDKRQFMAAMNAGLRTEYVGRPSAPANS
ncbi:MAG: type II toxin-antitoxin system VapC family toxin [Deltaproteobacteria bacterium]|nr:type II toxin-antitoxin system VapC family toxin [Deltaproteobacteria bacterium]